MNELTQYWSDAHSSKNIAALSDHSLAKHIEFLKFRVPECGKILCIGAGTGSWIRELEKHTYAEITVLDTCVEALQGFKGFTNPSDLPVDYFDLAISMWVAPHMFTQKLYEQLYYVIRSLKFAGIFALHYNEPVGKPSMPEHDWVAKAGRISCTRDKFKEMVYRYHGVYDFVNEISCPSLEMKMVAAHLRRAQ